MFVLFEWQGLSSWDGRYLCNLVYLWMLVVMFGQRIADCGESGDSWQRELGHWAFHAVDLGTT